MKKREIWKPIKGWEELYDVSNLGNVKRLERNYIDSLGRNVTISEKVLSVHFNKRTGYQRVNLSFNGKAVTYDVHRLVAEAFIPNPDDLPFINHKDENRRNNLVDNLEWCTPSYNTTYNGARQRAELTRRKNFNPKKILQYDLNGNLIQTFNCGANELERRYGYSIKECLRGKCKTANGFVYRYEGEPFSYVENIPVRHQKWVEKINPDGTVIERYKSASEAATKNGFERHRLLKKDPNGIAIVHGMMFRVEQKENEFIPKGRKGPRPDLVGKGGKKVLQFSKDGIFVKEHNSIREASDSLGGKIAPDISKCCNGLLKSVAGFIWRFKGSRKPKPFKNNTLRKVEQYTFDGEYVKTYNSIKEAANATGASTTGIGNNLSGRANSAFGFIWKYAKE